MTLYGDIRTFSLAAIGRLINAERKTGRLEVTSGRHATRIYFKDGGIIFIEGHLTEELSLGSLLKAAGLIGVADLKAALAEARRTGKRLGVVLIERGALSREALVRVLHLQFKEAVAKILAWREGLFSYSEGLGDFVEDIRLEIDPIRLVAAAGKWKEYRHHIPDDRVVFEIAAAGRPQTLDNDGARRVLLMLDGRRTVADLIKATGLSRVGVYKALMALIQEGLIVRRDRPPSPGSDVVENTRGVVAFFLKLLEGLQAGLAAEIGYGQAVALVAEHLRRHPQYADGLQAFDPAQDYRTNLERIDSRLRDAGGRPPSRDWVPGFERVVGDLLQSAHRLLGLRAVLRTVARARAQLEGAGYGDTPLAAQVFAFMDARCGSEASLMGSAAPAASDGTRPGAATASLLGLEKIQRGTLVRYYGGLVLALLRDLEQEIGSQVEALFFSIVRQSEHYNSLLAPLDPTLDIDQNARRIHAHTSVYGVVVDKRAVVEAFEALIAALLYEEKRLLGERAFRSSVANLERQSVDTVAQKYPPLHEYFMAFLRATAEA